MQVCGTARLIFPDVLTRVFSSDMIWSLCGVSVGFMGEVVKLSEKNRWLPGQSRYVMFNIEFTVPCFSSNICFLPKITYLCIRPRIVSVS